MPFPFTYVCDHLDELEKLVDRPSPLLHRDLNKKTNDKTIEWLRRHQKKLDAQDTDADTVILTFRPERRTDRDYGLDAQSLEQVIARVLNLPRKYVEALQRWRQEPARFKLPSSVQSVLNAMNDSKERVVTPSSVNQVTVEQVDAYLLEIASHNKASSGAVRGAKKHQRCDAIGMLGDLYRRLRPREAKWLTSLILKDFGAVKFPDDLDCGPYLSKLPHCVKVNATFKSSMPDDERRDGPGRLRRQRYNNMLPMPSNTAPKPASSFAASGPALMDHTPRPTVLLEIDRNRLSKSATSSQISHLDKSQHSPRRASPGARRSPSKTFSQCVFTDTGGPTCIIRTARPTRKGTSSCSPMPSMDTGSPKYRPPPRTSIETPALSPMTILGAGSCGMTETICPLANCIFLLAPCIAKVPWITDNLLKWHGSRFVTSPNAFSHPEFPRRCPQTGKEYRKIILIEPHKKDQTVEFLRRVQRLNSRRSRAQQRPVEVFDWRILEFQAKLDRGGKDMASRPWRKYKMFDM